MQALPIKIHCMDWSSSKIHHEKQCKCKRCRSNLCSEGLIGNACICIAFHDEFLMMIKPVQWILIGNACICIAFHDDRTRIVNFDGQRFGITEGSWTIENHKTNLDEIKMFCVPIKRIQAMIGFTESGPRLSLWSKLTHDQNRDTTKKTRSTRLVSVFSERFIDRSRFLLWWALWQIKLYVHLAPAIFLFPNDSLRSSLAINEQQLRSAIDKRHQT